MTVSLNWSILFFIMNWDWEKLQEKRQRQNRPQADGFDLGELKNKFKGYGDFRSSGLKYVVLVFFLLWLGSGIYIVNPDQVGVVQRFGAFNRITGPGPHYHLPYPVEKAQTPSVTEIKRLEIGFRTSGYQPAFQKQYGNIAKESLMLTGDENIVDVQFIVQYKIKDAKDYLFNVSQPNKTVKDAAEAAMRAVIGKNKIDAVLTTQKYAIQSETQNLLQSILDNYHSGIKITAIKLQDVHPPQQVLDAFKDVASAKEDKSRYINQAQAYRNDILPKARGQVATILNQAEAYKESKIRQAKGESARFVSVLKEYKKAKDVTLKRMYLETMEQIWSRSSDKIIMSQKAAKGVVPYLPLGKSGQINVRKGIQSQKGEGK